MQFSLGASWNLLAPTTGNSIKTLNIMLIEHSKKHCAITMSPGVFLLLLHAVVKGTFDSNASVAAQAYGNGALSRIAAGWV
jgi:hypothetical protein